MILIVTLGGAGRCFSGIWGVEAKDTATHPTVHRIAPTKDFLTSNVISCREKLNYMVVKNVHPYTERTILDSKENSLT